MKYVHSVIGIVFACFAVMALTATPFIYIAIDGIAACLIGTIFMLCGLISHAFLEAAEAAEQYERRAAQDEELYQARMKARNNG